MERVKQEGRREMCMLWNNNWRDGWIGIMMDETWMERRDREHKTHTGTTWKAWPMVMVIPHATMPMKEIRDGGLPCRRPGRGR